MFGVGVGGSYSIGDLGLPGCISEVEDMGPASPARLAGWSAERAAA